MGRSGHQRSHKDPRFAAAAAAAARADGGAASTGGGAAAAHGGADARLRAGGTVHDGGVGRSVAHLQQQQQHAHHQPMRQQSRHPTIPHRLHHESREQQQRRRQQQQELELQHALEDHPLSDGAAGVRMPASAQRQLAAAGAGVQESAAAAAAATERRRQGGVDANQRKGLPSLQSPPTQITGMHGISGRHIFAAAATAAVSPLPPAAHAHDARPTASPQVDNDGDEQAPCTSEQSAAAARADAAASATAITGTLPGDTVPEPHDAVPLPYQVLSPHSSDMECSDAGEDDWGDSRDGCMVGLENRGVGISNNVDAQRETEGGCGQDMVRRAREGRGGETEGGGYPYGTESGRRQKGVDGVDMGRHHQVKTRAEAGRQLKEDGGGCASDKQHGTISHTSSEEAREQDEGERQSKALAEVISIHSGGGEEGKGGKGGHCSILSVVRVHRVWLYAGEDGEEKGRVSEQQLVAMAEEGGSLVWVWEEGCSAEDGAWLDEVVAMLVWEERGVGSMKEEGGVEEKKGEYAELEEDRNQLMREREVENDREGGNDGAGEEAEGLKVSPAVGDEGERGDNSDAKLKVEGTDEPTSNSPRHAAVVGGAGASVAHANAENDEKGEEDGVDKQRGGLQQARDSEGRGGEKSAEVGGGGSQLALRVVKLETEAAPLRVAEEPHLMPPAVGCADVAMVPAQSAAAVAPTPPPPPPPPPASERSLEDAPSLPLTVYDKHVNGEPTSDRELPVLLHCVAPPACIRATVQRALLQLPHLSVQALHSPLTLTPLSPPMHEPALSCTSAQLPGREGGGERVGLEVSKNALEGLRSFVVELTKPSQW